MEAFADCLMAQSGIRILQKFELAEVFGFEGRNKYALADMNGQTIGFAAEQGKGIVGWFLRQYLGHWRRFDVTIFDNQRKPVLQLKHPFRWFFQKMDVCLPNNRCIGSPLNGNCSFSVVDLMYWIAKANCCLRSKPNVPCYVGHLTFSQAAGVEPKSPNSFLASCPNFSRIGTNSSSRSTTSGLMKMSDRSWLPQPFSPIFNTSKVRQNPTMTSTSGEDGNLWRPSSTVRQLIPGRPAIIVQI